MRRSRIFPKLLKQAEDGEEVVVMRNGDPVVKLVRCRQSHRKKVQLGWAAADTCEVPGWDKPMTEAEAAVFLKIK